VPDRPRAALDRRGVLAEIIGEPGLVIAWTVVDPDALEDDLAGDVPVPLVAFRFRELGQPAGDEQVLVDALGRARGDLPFPAYRRSATGCRPRA